VIACAESSTAEGERAPFLHDESETFLKKPGGPNPSARSGVLLSEVRKNENGNRNKQVLKRGEES
jgi:hypothetical protein